MYQIPYLLYTPIILPGLDSGDSHYTNPDALTTI